MGGFERTRNSGSTPSQIEVPAPHVADTLLHSAPKLDRTSAKAMGYTGNQCIICSGVRMRVSGHCEVCEECGNSSGCS